MDKDRVGRDRANGVRTKGTGVCHPGASRRGRISYGISYGGSVLRNCVVVSPGLRWLAGEGIVLGVGIVLGAGIVTQMADRGRWYELATCWGGGWGYAFVID